MNTKTQHVIIGPVGSIRAIWACTRSIAREYPNAQITIREVDGRKLEKLIQAADRVYVAQQFADAFPPQNGTRHVVFFSGLMQLYGQLQEEIPTSGIEVVPNGRAKLRMLWMSRAMQS